MRERVDSRVVGAFELLDAASGRPVESTLRVRAAGLRLVRNRRGYYVIHALPGFEEFITDWTTALPLAGREFELDDLSGRYQPRLFRINLPSRELVAVEVFPTPAAPMETNWATVFVEVRSQTGDPVAGAAVRLVEDGRPQPWGRGLTGVGGSAVVAARGLPFVQTGVAPAERLLGILMKAEASANSARSGVVDPDTLGAPPGTLKTGAGPAFRLRPGAQLNQQVVIDFT